MDVARISYLIKPSSLPRNSSSVALDKLACNLISSHIAEGQSIESGVEVCFQLGAGADLVCVAFYGHAEGTAQAQIRNFEAILAVVYQQVLWLQVAVHDAMLVAVRYSFDQLVHEALQKHRDFVTRKEDAYS